MRCKIGDLAVAGDTDHRGNLGCIVRVLAPHDGSGDIVFTNEGPVWLVACARPMTWSLKGKRYRRRIGPVPDCRLQPIRGVPSGGEVSAAVGKLFEKAKRTGEKIEV